jgi:Uroporphyrinogen decarboxylase (URO-D)
MNGRKRFNAIMSYEKFDRLPLWFFGTWRETFLRWQEEMEFSCREEVPNAAGMDPEWEIGMWDDHGLVNLWPKLDLPIGVIEEDDNPTIDWLTNFYISLLEPVLKTAKFDVAYIFEDCCGKNGPLFSPDTYRRFYHKYYCKLTEFLHSMGIKHVMMDSDGQVEELIPLWLDSGIDIIFPIEIGTWHADPVELRRKFGKSLKMFGGVNKHVISQGETAIRKELEHLKPLVMEGGFIPIPDHRIPPGISFSQLKDYFKIFNDVFKDIKK